MQSMKEELTCPICLNIFTDPVVLQCGHCFCLNCIQAVLDTKSQSKLYTCPECRRKYSKRPLLWKNRKLQNIVECFKSMQCKKEGGESAHQDCPETLPESTSSNKTSTENVKSTSPSVATSYIILIKCKQIKQVLTLLQHASYCKETGTGNVEAGICTVPNCQTMKNVIGHMKQCHHHVRGCQVRVCAFLKQILSHRLNCKAQGCPYCQAMGRGRTEVKLDVSLDDAGPSRDPVPRPPGFPFLPGEEVPGAAISTLLKLLLPQSSWQVPQCKEENKSAHPTALA
ncbi:uncharacterized protein [Pyxicephalus adspersus]